MSNLHIIENESWQVGILPDAGASVAFGRVKRDGRWLDLMRPTPEQSYRDPSACASYVLIPWSNRIRDGHFRFRGKDYQLRVNFPDGTAIHGTAKEFPWTVDSADGKHIALSFDSRKFYGVNYPWQFSTRAEFKLDGGKFLTTVWLKNEDKSAMPAGFGHHPYFMRSLAGPNDTLQFEIPCAKYFVLENCMPSAPAIPVEPRVDFQKPRPLGEIFIDDCLTGRIDDKPMRFVYGESGTKIDLHFDPIFENVVLYVPKNQPFFAVEPVTNANDGFNLADKNIPGASVFVLDPDQEKQGTFSLEVDN